jgi:uncharacterized membrane protein
MVRACFAAIAKMHHTRRTGHNWAHIIIKVVYIPGVFRKHVSRHTNRCVVYVQIILTLYACRIINALRSPCRSI